MVEDVVTAGGKDDIPTRIYLDDIILFSDDIDDLLSKTALAIERLASAGFMMNLRKSSIGVTEGLVLGHLWRSGGLFSPVDTKLRALIDMPDAKLARMSVPSIYGLLSYFRGYVPDFPLRTEPLRKLLAHSHRKWLPEHTACVRETVNRILSGVPTLNFEPSAPLRIETHVG